MTTLYSPFGGTITVDPTKVSGLVSQGWSESPFANPTKPYPVGSVVLTVSPVSSTPPVISTLSTTASVQKVTLYSPNGGTITVAPDKVVGLIGEGWSQTPFSSPTKPYSTPTTVAPISSTPSVPVSTNKVTLYSPFGGTITVTSDKVSGLINEGWSQSPFTSPSKPYPVASVPIPPPTSGAVPAHEPTVQPVEPKVTLFSPYGGTVTVAPDKVASLVVEGWSKIQPKITTEAPSVTERVTLYSPNGSTIAVTEDKVAKLTKEGWLKTEPEPSATSHILLPGDKWILKEDWGNLDEKYQAIGKSEGFDVMASVIKADAKKFKEDNVELIDHTWIPKENWNQLDQKYKDIGLKQGYDAMAEAIVKDTKQYETEKIQFEKDNIELADHKWISRKEWADVPQEYQDIGLKRGYSVMVQAIQKSQKEQKEEYSKQLALNALEPYKDAESNYNLVQFYAQNKLLTDHAKNVLLRKAGFDPNSKTVQDAKKQGDAKSGFFSGVWQGMTPWDESKGERASAKGVFVMAGENLVPGIYLARHWKNMTVGEKALFIGIDAISMIPVVTAGARGARLVSVTGKAERASRLAGAVKGVGREAVSEAVSQIIAPINMIIHPVSTVRSGIRETAGLIENIASPKRLPEASVTNIFNTIKFRITDATTKAEAMAMRDEIVKMAGMSKDKTVAVQIGNNVVEITRSPLMRETGGVAHGTPFAEQMLGKKLTSNTVIKVGEEGMYISPTPAPRFSTATSRGAVGERHAIVIIGPETAKKIEASNKIYRNTAEMEGVLPKGTEIPLKQKLYTRIGVTGQYTEIWLEKPLSLKQIAKLKAEGLAEVISQPFKPAITHTQIQKGRVVTVTGEDTKELARVLRTSGNSQQARSLVRAEALVNTERILPRRLSKTGGRVTRTELERARIQVRESVGIVKLTEKPRVQREETRTRAGREITPREAVRVTVAEKERETRKVSAEREYVPREVPRSEVPRETPRVPTKETPREIVRETPKLSERRPPTREEPRETIPRGTTRQPIPREPIPREPREGIPLKEKHVNLPQLSLLKRQGEKGGHLIPNGSIAWRQGIFWKFIPPPWNQQKPITLKNPPHGAINTGGRTPQQTIQMIGKSGARVPKTASVDLGVVDILIDDYGKAIRFVGRGLETQVGSLSKTTGMSVPGASAGFRRKVRIVHPEKTVHRNHKKSYFYASTV